MKISPILSVHIFVVSVKACFNVIVANHAKSLPEAILAAFNLLQFVATCVQFLDSGKNPVTRLPGSFLFFSSNQLTVICLCGGEIRLAIYFIFCK